MPLFDDISRNYSRTLSLKVIDMSPLYARADAHPGWVTAINSEDCFHLCAPGVLDFYSQVVLTMLFNEEI